MLVKFSVGNFLSFDKILEFSMKPGKVRRLMNHVIRDRNCSLLKFAAIYGANASGKSALVKALDFAQKVIVQAIPVDISKLYCRSCNKIENKTLPSTFEFEVKLDNKIYRYGFKLTMTSRSIKEEWLEKQNSDGFDLIYRHDVDTKKFTFGNLSKSSLQALKLYSDNLIADDSELFLTEMNRNKKGFYDKNTSLDYLQKLYLWFKFSLVVNYPEEALSPTLFLDQHNLELANTVFQKLDLGFSELRLIDSFENEVRRCLVDPSLYEQLRTELLNTAMKQQKEKNEINSGALLRGRKDFFIFSVDSESLDITVKRLGTYHKNSDEEFDLSEESDGTVRMIDLVELIIASKLGVMKTYVIDEVDRLLHPMLTRKLIETYLASIEEKNIQLIVTTHEQSLLKDNLLRQDEISFLSMNEMGSTQITSLRQFEERTDKSILRAYLNGEYGGIPKLN